jgi:hypothetical protein
MESFLHHHTDQLCKEKIDEDAVPAYLKQDILQNRALRKALTQEEMSKLHLPEPAAAATKAPAKAAVIEDKVTARDLVYYLLSLRQEQEGAKLQAEFESRSATDLEPVALSAKMLSELHVLLKSQLPSYADNVCMPSKVLNPYPSEEALTSLASGADPKKKGQTQELDVPPDMSTFMRAQLDAGCDEPGFVCAQWSNSTWTQEEKEATLYVLVSNGKTDAAAGAKKGGKGKTPRDEDEDKAGSFKFDRVALTITRAEALQICGRIGELRAMLQDSKQDPTPQQQELFDAIREDAEQLLNPSGNIHPSMVVDATASVAPSTSSRPSTKSGRKPAVKEAEAETPGAIPCSLRSLVFFESLFDATTGTLVSSPKESQWLRRTLSVRISESPFNSLSS